MTQVRSLLGRRWAGLAPLMLGSTAAGVTLLLSSCGATNSPALSRHAGAVEIKNFSFTPARLTVKAGAKIAFSNGDATEHTATVSANGGFDTGTLAQGRSNTVVLSKPGVYSYHCAFHAFMTGTITVQ